MEELAEVLAVDFGDEKRIPKLIPNWRWEEEEQALIASCSSLIAIVESGQSRVVQFSHYSVKEFLTSARLATSSGDISCYHINLEPAHTILAQACMAVLLRSDNGVEEGEGGNISPLARYAAQHWVVHAQDEKVSSCIRNAMEDLFDVDKPYFAAWIDLCDIDTYVLYGPTFYPLTHGCKSGATPLYYAARLGFQDLVEHLVACHPKQVNATGGHYVTPLVAALAEGHFQIAEFLYQNGAYPSIKGYRKITPLHSAAYFGDVEMVQILLKYKADVHARNAWDGTPLSFALGSEFRNSAISFSDVARLLLEHGADGNARDDGHYTPLHSAAQTARYGKVGAIRVLLEHGVEVNARAIYGTTPLHQAAEDGTVEAIRVLVELGADVNARENDDIIPLHQAARNGRVEAVRVLVEFGADVNARKADDTTPLHEAARNGTVEAVHLLVELGADVSARKKDDTTPLHEAARNERVEAIRVLVELGADVNVRKNDDTTPLHQAVRYGEYDWVDTISVLLELGADVNARTKDDTTPLHVAAQRGMLGRTRVLLKHGANVGAEDGRGKTALQVASERGEHRIMTLLSERGAGREHVVVSL